MRRDLFEDYYRRQGVTGEDFEAFMGALERPLPIAFRVILGTVHTKWVKEFIDKVRRELPEEDRRLLEPLRFLRYGEGWVLKTSRQDLRRNPLLKELHQFLVQQSENGVVIRQEVVSMIPASFLLDWVLPKAADAAMVLDMCSAPGSKTSQLLEGLESVKTGPLTRGVVVANDINSTRAHMLVHHLKYQHSPSLIVTLHNSTTYPRLFNQDGDCIKFDGVLCDVPCSGDGTIRKAPSIFKKWHHHDGLHIHGLQLRILKKGLMHAKVGGCVVYSTCTFNPLEDEAVVAAILRTSGSAVRLRKVPLNGLVHRPGLRKWSVKYKDQWFTSHAEAEAKFPGKMWASAFAPTEEDIQRELEDKCYRFLPQDNDTGGFFVAVFEKIGNLPWEHGRPTTQSSTEVACREELDENAESDEENELAKSADAWPTSPDCSQLDLINLAGVANRSKIEQQTFTPVGVELTEALAERLWFRKTEDKLDERAPRKLWMVSDSASMLLRSKTFRKPWRVLYAGTTCCEFRSFDTGRFTAFGFLTCLKLEQKRVASLKAPRLIVLEPEEMRELLKGSRLNIEQNPESAVAKRLSSLDQDSHNMVVCFVDKEVLASPLYHGKQNVELLLNEPLRAAYRCLLQYTLKQA